MPFTTIPASMVDVDSPVSTTLMTFIKEDLDYLKATLSDGASAPQDIVGKNITANGNLTATGDITVDGGNFFSSAPVFNFFPAISFNTSATFDFNLTFTGLDLDLVQNLIFAEGF